MHCSWCARYDLFAVALPPLRPAAFFCAVVPPCDELLREELDEPDFLPPRLDEPEEFAIFAARSFDMPLSFNASYCFSFFTFELLPGMRSPLSVRVSGAADIPAFAGTTRRALASSPLPGCRRRP